MSDFFKELNLKKLSVIDDLSKYLVLDPYLGFKISKINLHEISKFIRCDEKTISEIIEQNISNLNHEEIWHKLSKCLNCEVLLTFISNLDYLRKQVLCYLKIIQPDSLVLVEESFRYSCLQRQAKLIANSDFEKNTKVHAVSSFYAEEQLLLEKRKVDFSIINTTGCKNSSLLLGPVALVNHDCRANCSYIKDTEGKICINTKRKIKKTEELTVCYSKDYFESNNFDCECETCEKLMRNAYSRPKKTIQIEDLSRCNDFVANAIKLKKLIEHLMTSENLCFERKYQRKINNKCNNSLMHNNVLYNKFINFLKTSNMIKDFTALISFTEEEINEIVIATYKNDHISSYTSVKKFINIYQEKIKSDVKDYTENTEILAPEQKNMEDYFHKLIQICIQFFPENAALCIFQGEKLLLKHKRIILQKLLIVRGNTPKLNDKTKLDNTFSKYNVYLQSLSQNLILEVLNTVMLRDIKERKVAVLIPKLLLEQDNISNEKAESSRTCSEFTLNLPYTLEEINEILGM